VYREEIDQQNMRTEQPPTIKDIAEWAARINSRNDYQVAQNDAYAHALRLGFSEELADECARLAGSLHEDCVR
jgi:hypothetical protein